MSDKPKCKGPECDREFMARELCGSHYQQLREGKPLKPLRKAKTLEESVGEFTPTVTADTLSAPRITVEKLYNATTSVKVSDEAVRDSACSYDAKVTEEGYDAWLRRHDAEVLMLAANSFAQSPPYSWQQDAAYTLEYMARDRREGRC